MHDAKRISEHPNPKVSAKYAGLTREGPEGPVWNGTVRIADEETLRAPARWTRPSRIFVNSMSDLFHENLPDADVTRILDVIAENPRHAYQILTKRADRMAELVAKWLDANGLEILPPNVEIGVSAEDSRRFAERLPGLLKTRASFRWISMEPMIGPIDAAPAVEADVDLLVVGGESLPFALRKKKEVRAKPFDVSWAENVLDVVRRENARKGDERPKTRFFMKQLGENPVGASRRTAKGDQFDEFPEKLRVRELP
jgi:protein gp37